MFEVRMGDGIWRRNANQLLKYQIQPEELESRVSPKLEVSEDEEVGPETASELDHGWLDLSDSVANPEHSPEAAGESNSLENSEPDLPASDCHPQTPSTPVTQPVA